MTIADVVREQVFDRVINPANRRVYAHWIILGLDEFVEYLRELRHIWNMPDTDQREFLELRQIMPGLTVEHYQSIKFKLPKY